jgi:hypothetical protein
MIKAHHIWWADRIFQLYIYRLLKKHFYSVEIFGNPPLLQTNKSILLIPNHSTWWDGFFVYLINKKCFNRPLYLMMLERELRKFRFFSKVGAYSIEPENPISILKTLKYTHSLLEKKHKTAPIICFFPQGELLPWGTRPLGFKKGLEWLLKNASTSVSILPLAMRAEFREEQSPQIFFQFGELQDLKLSTFSGMVQLENQMEKLLDSLLLNIEQKKSSKRILQGIQPVNQRWKNFQNKFSKKKDQS